MPLQPGAKVYDLAQQYFVGMPHYPTHPPYLYSLTKKHGDQMYGNGGSSAADAIALGSHVGTHIDALCHFSCNGFVYGGVKPEQDYCAGISEHSVDRIAPIVRRGVLLDLGVLGEDVEVTPDDLERAANGVAIGEGDVVLLRTGWAERFEDAKAYTNGGRTPGPGMDGARWFSERKVFAAGSDTMAFEKLPSSDMSVHVHLLAESGIHIIEVLNLEELARDRVREFLFVAAPLKLRGATGAPLRPLAFPEF